MVHGATSRQRPPCPGAAPAAGANALLSKTCPGHSTPKHLWDQNLVIEQNKNTAVPKQAHSWLWHSPVKVRARPQAHCSHSVLTPAHVGSGSALFPTAASTASTHGRKSDTETSLLWFVGELVPISAPADCLSENCRTSPKPQTFKLTSDAPENISTGDFGNSMRLNLQWQ